MSDLPQDREKALERIAAGWGRTATSAHPFCICGKPGTPPAEPPTPPIHDRHNCCDECNDAAWTDWRKRRDEIRAEIKARTCPMHAKGRR